MSDNMYNNYFWDNSCCLLFKLCCSGGTKNVTSLAVNIAR